MILHWMKLCSRIVLFFLSYQNVRLRSRKRRNRGMLYCCAKHIKKVQRRKMNDDVIQNGSAEVNAPETLQSLRYLGQTQLSRPDKRRTCAVLSPSDEERSSMEMLSTKIRETIRSLQSAMWNN